MASTYSDLKFELIGTGEQSGTWGTTTNTNLGTAIQEAITGSADVTFASGTVTLTLTNTNASQTARNLRLNLTGTSGGAQDLIVPTIEKFYLVNNGCADAITVKNSTGTGIAVPAGKAMLLFNNATNVVDAVTHMSSLTLTTALAIAQGGTGATTADTALDNLGGTTTGKAVFKAANAAAAQQAMDTEVGVDVQAYDAGLTDIAGLAVTDGNIIVGDGTNWVAENGATARTSLGLGSIATQASSSVTITGGSITGITDLAVADGGTGQGSYTDGELLIGNSTGNTLTKATLTAGSGISVTNGSGSITIAASGGGGFSNLEAFTSPGTWTNPGNVAKVKVTVVGGGGGGGGSGPSPANNPGFSGGGGGGGAAIEVIPFPTATNVSVTVGGGGTGPANAFGNAGGTSSFGAYCSATGGSGGFRNDQSNTNTNYNQPGAAGGAGSGGDINLSGGNGENMKTDVWGAGQWYMSAGQAGDSALGYGYGAHNVVRGFNNPAGIAGINGQGYGGGGGGCVKRDPSPNVAGGNGTGGIVIVEY
jgi:hypothetical protein